MKVPAGAGCGEAGPGPPRGEEGRRGNGKNPPSWIISRCCYCSPPQESELKPGMKENGSGDSDITARLWVLKSVMITKCRISLSCNVFKKTMLPQKGKRC